MASACSKPATGDFATLLGPLQKDTQAISKIKDDNRTSKVFFNHLSTIAEGAQCVGWVTLV
jgi:adenylyl cyclase-associated protein